MATYKIKNQFSLHYLTCTIVGWVDIFTRKEYKEIIIESLQFCQEKKGLRVHAFTIMSNHLHLIVSAKEGSKGLSRIIGDFKEFTAKQIIKTIKTIEESRKEWMLNIFAHYGKNNKRNQTYQVWIQDNHPIELLTPKWILQKINYIHQNAVEAGWVKEAFHFLYCSASNYRDGKGLLNVKVIDLGITDFYVHTI